MCAVSDVFKMVVGLHLATAGEIIKILSSVEVLYWTEIDLFFTGVTTKLDLMN